MKQIKILCDFCESDITDSQGFPRYRLVLSQESLPVLGGCVCDVLVQPPLDEVKYFCGVGCLKEWVKKSVKD